MNQTAAIAAITMSGMGPIICHLRLCRNWKFMIASRAAGLDPRTARRRPHQGYYAINVAIGGKADMPFCTAYVRLCPLMTQSGHANRGSAILITISCPTRPPGYDADENDGRTQDDRSGLEGL